MNQNNRLVPLIYSVMLEEKKTFKIEIQVYLHKCFTRDPIYFEGLQNSNNLLNRNIRLVRLIYSVILNPLVPDGLLSTWSYKK